MPLSRSEIAIVHQAAALSASGVPVRWRFQRLWPSTTWMLWWYRADQRERLVKVTSAMYEGAFRKLRDEAARVFQAEVERLTRRKAS